MEQGPLGPRGRAQYSGRLMDGSGKGEGPTHLRQGLMAKGQRSCRLSSVIKEVIAIHMCLRRGQWSREGMVASGLK